jgi:hypothetical protein
MIKSPSVKSIFGFIFISRKVIWETSGRNGVFYPPKTTVPSGHGLAGIRGGKTRRSTEQQDHHDDDEDEAGSAASNPDGAGKNGK